MAKKAKRSTAKQAADVSDDGNVDKIREILFGGQMRDLETRVAELEAALGAQVEKAVRNLDSRLEKFDAKATRELEKLSERLKSERSERLESGKLGGKAIDQLGKQLDKSMASMQAHVDNELGAIDSALEAKGEEMQAIVDAVVDEAVDKLSTRLDSEIGRLTEASLSREELADLLSGFATSLRKKR